MLEEKLAHKRTQQMMLLQQKHTKETEVRCFVVSGDGSPNG